MIFNNYKASRNETRSEMGCAFHFRALSAHTFTAATHMLLRVGVELKNKTGQGFPKNLNWHLKYPRSRDKSIGITKG
jgi:hypothetical protein